MFRFKLNGNDWIVRFSPTIDLPKREKKEIINSLLELGIDLGGLGHCSSFLIFLDDLGAVVFEIKEVPSLILTVSTIIPKEHWYKKKRCITVD